MTPIRVLHVASGLHVGGAERALARLVTRLDPAQVRSSVVSLTDRGPVGAEIEAAGVPVSAVGMRGAVSVPPATAALWRIMKRDRPDVVQTWMYQADVVGGVTARLAGIRNVVWGIRASDFPRGSERPFTQFVIRLAASLSRTVPTRIVACGAAALEIHVAAGYPRGRSTVIPNGFELPAPRAHAREWLRKELGVREDAILVGRVARYHTMKDYPTLLRASTVLLAAHENLHMVLVGADVTDDNETLSALADATAHRERVHLLGPRADVIDIHAALDVACSSSRSSEGFPNVLGEAMSVGVPVVTTDVGDSALLVGDTGLVVPPDDPAALAVALDELVSAAPVERARLGAAARRRIADEFSLDRMAERFTALYADLVRDRGAIPRGDSFHDAAQRSRHCR